MEKAKLPENAGIIENVADFEKARSVIKEITGVDTKLFRFPGGSINSYNKKVYKDIIKEMKLQLKSLKKIHIHLAKMVCFMAGSSTICMKSMKRIRK